MNKGQPGAILGQFNIARFSTEAFPEHERVTAWREFVGRTIMHFNVETVDPDVFQSEATFCALPGLRVLFGSSGAVRMDHPPGLPVDDHLCLVVAQSCTWMASQLARDIVLGPGEAILMTSSKVGALVFGSSSHFTMACLPRAAIAPLVPDLDSVVARPIPADSLPLQLLCRYFDLLRDGPLVETPMLQQLAVIHVYDLLVLVLKGATRDVVEISKGGGVRAMRLLRVKGDMLANLGDADLNIEAVAKRHGITPRYVQLMFESEGTTFSAFLRDRRLARARRILMHPRHADRTVSAIAHEVGFGDLPYFNRMFRRLYGSSPSDLRAEARREDQAQPDSTRLGLPGDS